MIAFARDNGQACVQVFFVRGGKLIGREYFVLPGTQDEDATEVMTSFVTQFYDEAAAVPPEILVQHDLDELAVIESWLRQKRGTKVTIKVPKRGEKHDLMKWPSRTRRYPASLAGRVGGGHQPPHTEALTVAVNKALALPRRRAHRMLHITNLQGTR